jgi:hypothetical protein
MQRDALIGEVLATESRCDDGTRFADAVLDFSRRISAEYAKVVK